MQLLITHKLENNLVLPLNHQHILQAIIYKSLENPAARCNDFLHDEGAVRGILSHKFFTFSHLKGRYEIANQKLIYFDEVFFEVRSPDIFMIRLLAERIAEKGISYGDYHVADVNTVLLDKTVERDMSLIEMMTPLCVCSTNRRTRKKYFYRPEEREFIKRINENFIRKYTAFYGTKPEGGVDIEPNFITDEEKIVTNYKGVCVSGWLGSYSLYGARKSLDFLYQTGLGSRNFQGFGMFQIV